MRLVNESALDNASVEELAERLGIGARHLLRLFKKHVGASPTQVAQTARVQRAKRMIDNSNLPMAESPRRRLWQLAPFQHDICLCLQAATDRAPARKPPLRGRSRREMRNFLLVPKIKFPLPARLPHCRSAQ